MILESCAHVALAIFLIDKIWGNRGSVDSTVKIDQSEGIATPAIQKRVIKDTGSPAASRLWPPSLFSRSFLLVPDNMQISQVIYSYSPKFWSNDEERYLGQLLSEMFDSLQYDSINRAPHYKSAY